MRNLNDGPMTLQALHSQYQLDKKHFTAEEQNRIETLARKCRALQGHIRGMIRKIEEWEDETGISFETACSIHNV